MLKIYTTEGCHLCEQALEILHQVAPSLNTIIEVELIDIAESDVLIEQYGVHIPVFEFSNEKLYWPFDAETLFQFLMEQQ